MSDIDKRINTLIAAACACASVGLRLGERHWQYYADHVREINKMINELKKQKKEL